MLSDCGDRELDILIEEEILNPISEIVITINYNIPKNQLEILDLIDFPWKPLNTSQLHHFPDGFSWNELKISCLPHHQVSQTTILQ